MEKEKQVRVIRSVKGSTEIEDCKGGIEAQGFASEDVHR